MTAPSLAHFQFSVLSFCLLLCLGFWFLINSFDFFFFFWFCLWFWSSHLCFFPFRLFFQTSLSWWLKKLSWRLTPSKWVVHEYFSCPMCIHHDGSLNHYDKETEHNWTQSGQTMPCQCVTGWVDVQKCVLGQMFLTVLASLNTERACTEQRACQAVPHRPGPTLFPRPWSCALLWSAVALHVFQVLYNPNILWLTVIFASLCLGM